MSGTIQLPHTCPKCGSVAMTYQELNDKFGFRNLPGGAANQSWCRECRSSKGKWLKMPIPSKR